MLYQTVLENGHVTKRDIYYRKVALFGSQKVVDKVSPFSRPTILTFSAQIVDDLVYSAGLKRQDFHVCAASKGLIASNALSIHLVTGEELPVLSMAGTLIPPQERIARLEAPSGLDWVLVVEKDVGGTSNLVRADNAGGHAVAVWGWSVAGRTPRPRSHRHGERTTVFQVVLTARARATQTSPRSSSSATLPARSPTPASTPLLTPTRTASTSCRCTRTAPAQTRSQRTTRVCRLVTACSGLGSRRASGPCGFLLQKCHR